MEIRMYRRTYGRTFPPLNVISGTHEEST